MSREHEQDLKQLASSLEAMADRIRKNMRPVQKGVFLVKSRMGYGVVIDGFDLGIDTGWSDANKICRIIASRRPDGDTIGYGHNMHDRMPKEDELKIYAVSEGTVDNTIGSEGLL